LGGPRGRAQESQLSEGLTGMTETTGGQASPRDEASLRPEAIAPLPNSPFSGVALLGWMDREKAIHFLTEDCLFDRPVNEADAESLWREWRDRAASIPERAPVTPVREALSEEERSYSERFIEFLGSLGVTNTQVVKIDPMELVVVQHHVAIEIAMAYTERSNEGAGWMELALPMSFQNPNLNITFTRKNLDTDIDIDLPHGEFLFGVNPHGGFGPKEVLSHISVMELGSRMLLGKGYHRLYGHVANSEGRFPQRLSLAALDPGTLSPPARTAAGNGTSVADAGLSIFGSRPPLFADFFTEGLAMPVVLRRKRYQLQVRSRWVASNEP